MTGPPAIKAIGEWKSPAFQGQLKIMPIMIKILTAQDFLLFIVEGNVKVLLPCLGMIYDLEPRTEAGPLPIDYVSNVYMTLSVLLWYIHP